MDLNDAAEIVSTLENIIQQRNNGQIGDDYIEIRFFTKDVMKLFADNDFIKLSCNEGPFEMGKIEDYDS